ncbi:MAG TPA: thioredoxin domain-containing protein, partial [Hyphomonadaceae bacterium]|nr:thioredoxin domain-containing protein [Hyphomonadaceae bacterium]
MSFKAFGAVLAALALAACGGQTRASLTPVQGDSFLGNPSAALTVYEYGAPTCPGCKAWHDQYWAKLKAAYIDTNKIKFVFREFPSHNPPVDAAIFAIARCSGTADYFPVLDEAFARQQKIDNASRSATGPMGELESLGAAFKLSAEQVHSCIDDPKMHQRIFDVQAMGAAQGVEYTPTFVINGKIVEDATYDSLSAQIVAALAVPASPASTPAPAATAPAAAAPAPAPASPAPAAP